MTTALFARKTVRITPARLFDAEPENSCRAAGGQISAAGEIGGLAE